MSDVKVYMLANLQIHDAEKYRLYEKGFFPILKKHKGEFITYDDNIVHVEGAKPMEGRVILFCFPSARVAICPVKCGSLLLKAIFKVWEPSTKPPSLSVIS